MSSLGFDVPSDTVAYRSIQGRPFQAKCTQTDNNETVSLTFTELTAACHIRNMMHKLTN